MTQILDKSAGVALWTQLMCLVAVVAISVLYIHVYGTLLGKGYEQCIPSCIVVVPKPPVSFQVLLPWPRWFMHLFCQHLSRTLSLLSVSHVASSGYLLFSIEHTPSVNIDRVLERQCVANPRTFSSSLLCNAKPLPLCSTGIGLKAYNEMSPWSIWGTGDMDKEAICASWLKWRNCVSEVGGKNPTHLGW